MRLTTLRLFPLRAGRALQIPRHPSRSGAIPAVLSSALAAGVVAALLVSVPLCSARAQGSLEGQGFGYPPGQLSTRVMGAGGGFAEFDPVSPVNPAAVALFGRTTFAFQYDPEFRTTEVGGQTVHNTIARFPVLALGVPFRRRFTLGFSASTFLDRSFTTQYQTTTLIGGDSVIANEVVESRGSIADLRLTGAMYVAPWLQVGIAAPPAHRPQPGGFGPYLHRHHAVRLGQRLFDDRLRGLGVLRRERSLPRCGGSAWRHRSGAGAGSAPSDRIQRSAGVTPPIGSAWDSASTASREQRLRRRTPGRAGPTSAVSGHLTSRRATPTT